MFGKFEAVICRSCKLKDSNNSFKDNQVTIKANITKDGVPEEVSGIFTVQSAKCSRCHKILFTKMSKYNKLKKEAEEYFKKVYSTSEVKLTGIEL